MGEVETGHTPITARRWAHTFKYMLSHAHISLFCIAPFISLAFFYNYVHTSAKVYHWEAQLLE